MAYTRERQGQILYLEQQLNLQLKLFQNQHKTIKKENRKWYYQALIQLRQMEEALQQFDIIEIHAPNFVFDPDGGGDGPSATNH